MDSGGPLFPWLQWGKSFLADSKASFIGKLVIYQNKIRIMIFILNFIGESVL